MQNDRHSSADGGGEGCHGEGGVGVYVPLQPLNLHMASPTVGHKFWSCTMYNHTEMMMLVNPTGKTQPPVVYTQQRLFNDDVWQMKFAKLAWIPLEVATFLAKL